MMQQLKDKQRFCFNNEAGDVKLARHIIHFFPQDNQIIMDGDPAYMQEYLFIVNLSAQDETPGDNKRMSLCRINQISWLTWCSAACCTPGRLPRILVSL